MFTLLFVLWGTVTLGFMLHVRSVVLGGRLASEFLITGDDSMPVCISKLAVPYPHT